MSRYDVLYVVAFLAGAVVVLVLAHLFFAGRYQ
jgi:hypothetical protein